LYISYRACNRLYKHEAAGEAAMTKSANQTRRKPRKPAYRWLIYTALAIIYIWAFAGIPYTGIKETAGQITKAIVAGIFSPDWDYVYLPDGEDLLRGLLDTLAISMLGTFISTIICIP